MNIVNKTTQENVERDNFAVKVCGKNKTFNKCRCRCCFSSNKKRRRGVSLLSIYFFSQYVCVRLCVDDDNKIGFPKIKITRSTFSASRNQNKEG